MAKQAAAREYVVDYKAVNTQLKKKKSELQKLQPKVDSTGQKEISLQIKAIHVLLETCKSARMTHKYNGL